MDTRIAGGLAVRRQAERQLVVIVDDQAVDFVNAIAACTGDCPADVTLKTVFDEWSAWEPIVGSAIDSLKRDREIVQGWEPLGSLDLAPPVHPEASLIFTAANYAAHTSEAESSDKVQAKVSTGSDTPYVFLKPMRSVIGPNDDVVKPREVNQLDWEVELAVVIGKPGRRIPVNSAGDHIAGYLLCNDISARDFVRRPDWPMFSSDWFAQKAFDTFTPMGPAFVPVSQIADPNALRLRLTVGGEIMQDSLAEDMIFSIEEQISYASRFTTIQPGDIISTGTPAGVGMASGRYLNVGEHMRAEITGLGTQDTKIVAELGASD